MKATGIIRRVDDLGRVVIPKEIRRTMKIQVGDPLEIFLDTETNSVCFSKYYTLDIDNEEIINIALDMAKTSNIDIAIYNEDYRVTKINHNNLFPNNPPDKWYNKHKPFETDELFVIPIISAGELYGYVASNRSCNNCEALMIARYIAAALDRRN